MLEPTEPTFDRLEGVPRHHRALDVAGFGEIPVGTLPELPCDVARMIWQAAWRAPARPGFIDCASSARTECAHVLRRPRRRMECRWGVM